jgi:hypothetical protein
VGACRAAAAATNGAADVGPDAFLICNEHKAVPVREAVRCFEVIGIALNEVALPSPSWSRGSVKYPAVCCATMTSLLDRISASSRRRGRHLRAEKAERPKPYSLCEVSRETRRLVRGSERTQTAGDHVALAPPTYPRAANVLRQSNHGVARASQAFRNVFFRPRRPQGRPRRFFSL